MARKFQKAGKWHHCIKVGKRVVKCFKSQSARNKALRKRHAAGLKGRAVTAVR
jgi:hypothetical protein